MEKYDFIRLDMKENRVGLPEGICRRKEAERPVC